MKFHVLTAQKRAPRLGLLKSIEGKPNVEIQTPVVLLHTQGGHIPHITHEVFKLVSKEFQILQIPLVSVHNFRETLEYYDGTISEFIGSKNSLTCLTVHDPSNLTKQGHHTKNQVPVWTKKGKFLYDANTYMNLVESFKPDMYCLLSDGDTNIASAQKRITKAVDLTITLNRQCLERHRKSEILKKMFVIAPIAGGYCLRSRERCIKALLSNGSDVDGFLIDGLHNNGPEVEFLPHSDIKELVDFIVRSVPPEKAISVQGCWNPMNVIKLVQQGVDIFDTSYCRILTERSAAMTFAINDDEESDCYEINLRQANYADDFTPIMFSCDCLTCTKYSRGYIHHLLTVQELLGPILIMIHNIYHYLRLFKKIRECIANNTLNRFEQKVSEQFKNYQDRLLNVNLEEDMNQSDRRNDVGDT